MSKQLDSLKTKTVSASKRGRKATKIQETVPTRPYLTCKKRKGNPRIPLEVCKDSCPYRKNCQVIYEERNPSLFSQIEPDIL